MDWIIGVLLIVVGAIVGFFIAKYFADKKIAAQEEKLGESTQKEIMVQHAFDHIGESRQIVQSLQAKCQQLTEQLDSYESVLSASQEEAEGSKLSYFGEHATAYIRHQQNTQKREHKTAEFQPKDFSSESSGLFDGSKKEHFVDNP